MAKRIEEKFFKGVYDIIEYWAKQEKDNLTGEKFTDKDKIEGAFHSFFTMIEGCSSVNNFKHYTIHNKYGKELPNINGSCMYAYFRKFREDLTLPKEYYFSENEKTILRSLDKKWKWLGRDEDGKLFLFTDKPKKDNNGWQLVNFKTSYALFFDTFGHLFQSIQWTDDEPVEIEKVIKE